MVVESDDLVAREALHRVGNELAIAAAALRVARSRGGADPVVAAAEVRIGTAAEINLLLCRRPPGDLVALAAYLTSLHVPLARLGEAEGVTVVLFAEPMAATGAEALRVGMIATELVSNSIRHARRAAIRIVLTDAGGHATLAVYDGGGPGAWTREGGQGCGLVDALAAGMGGSVERGGLAGRSGMVRVHLPSVGRHAAPAAWPAAQWSE